MVTWDAVVVANTEGKGTEGFGLDDLQGTFQLVHSIVLYCWDTAQITHTPKPCRNALAHLLRATKTNLLFISAELLFTKWTYPNTLPRSIINLRCRAKDETGSRAFLCRPAKIHEPQVSSVAWSAWPKSNAISFSTVLRMILLQERSLLTMVSFP